MDRPHLAPVARPRLALRGRRAVRAATPLTLLTGLALALAACETVPPPAAAPPAAAGLADGPVKPFSTGKGWTVTVHTPPGGKPFCVAERGRPGEAPDGALAGAPPGTPRLAFRASAVESGFILSGFTPSDSGATVKPGERYDLVASLDQGARLTLSARGLPDGSLYVAVPTKSYLDEFEALARGRRVGFRSSGLGDLGTALLSGTSWAINASDECRILHADS